jgi:hypothetical protein
MADEAPETNAATESIAGKPAEDATTQIVYCARCGGVMNGTDRFCHACGWEVGSAEAPRSMPAPVPVVNPSDCNRLTLLLLCVLLGWLGAHRFYVGKIGTGLIWLFTLGFMGIGVIYDIIFIATGEFRDSHERRVVRWE